MWIDLFVLLKKYELLEHIHTTHVQVKKKDKHRFQTIYMLIYFCIKLATNNIVFFPHGLEVMVMNRGHYPFV